MSPGDGNLGPAGDADGIRPDVDEPIAPAQDQDRASRVGDHVRRNAPEQQPPNWSERATAHHDHVGALGLCGLDDAISRVALPDEELRGDTTPASVLDRLAQGVLALGANLVDAR
jgi:hypothetical protein